jgi:hypothetical protein
MENEIIAGIKKKLAEMTKIEATGFTDMNKAAEYFQEKEALLEDFAKALETFADTVAKSSAAVNQEVEALKGTVKSLREEIKGQAANPRELSRRELCYRLGKAIAAAWTRDNATLAELSCSPNMKSDNWTNPRDVRWDVAKGWQVNRAALGEPVGDMSTNDQYLINPIYETEIMQDAAKKRHKALFQIGG